MSDNANKARLLGPNATDAIENARKYVRLHLRSLSATSTEMDKAIYSLNFSPKKLEKYANRYVFWHTAATRSLQTILLRSKFGWEKAQAEHILWKLANTNLRCMDYKIQFEAHLPKEWE